MPNRSLIRASASGDSGGGAQKTLTVQGSKLSANFDSTSALALPSLGVCISVHCQSLRTSSLHSAMISAQAGSSAESDRSENGMTIYDASVSQMMSRNPLSHARDRPILTAAHSAMDEEQHWMLEAKPQIQSPRWSLKTPPAPAGPGLPLEQPSVLSLMQDGDNGGLQAMRPMAGEKGVERVDAGSSETRRRRKHAEKKDEVGSLGWRTSGSGADIYI